MDDPATEISSVIQKLTQSSPAVQQATLTKYFTPSASFTHPFCRTGSFDFSHRLDPDSALARLCREGGPLPLLSSRALTGGIYRWYKLMSPQIELDIDSIAFDGINHVLYVSLHQTFRIAVLPGYRAPVNLVTVLHLESDGGAQKPVYRISSQNDRYQVDEWIKFVSIFRVLWAFLIVGQSFASVISALGQGMLWPVVWRQEVRAMKDAREKGGNTHID